MNTATMSHEELALTEAREQLLRARDAVREFRREHGAFVGGRPVFFCAPEQRPKLDEEFARLEQIENAAHQKFQDSLAVWSDTRKK